MSMYLYVKFNHHAKFSALYELEDGHERIQFVSNGIGMSTGRPLPQKRNPQKLCWSKNQAFFIRQLQSTCVWNHSPHSQNILLPFLSPNIRIYVTGFGNEVVSNITLKPVFQFLTRYVYKSAENRKIWCWLHILITNFLCKNLYPNKRIFPVKECVSLYTHFDPPVED